MQFYKDFVNWLFDPIRFAALSVVGLWAMLRFRDVWTKPKFALGILIAVAVFFGISLTDPNFMAIIGKPDNVPISIMMAMTAFCLWLALRQASVNDKLIEAGEPPSEGGSNKEKVFVWPDLVYIEFLAAIVCFAFLILWAVVLKAPLEEPANPSVSPNPSKAPWYFLGLQEMLVYFDPWLAGVVFPSLIIVGLIAIPYFDPNPKGVGYYTFKERPFAISVFLFGFVVLWALLIVLGTILRGPNWNFFGPFEFWDPKKIQPLVNVNLSEYVYAKWLGAPLPTNWFAREVWGLLVVVGYLAIGPFLLLAIPYFRRFRAQMGAMRFHIFALLFLLMASLPIKMVLRWTMNLKYIVAIPEFFFNI